VEYASASRLITSPFLASF